MNNKDTFTANIENLSHEGRGVARIDGKTHFIINALPGEQVEANMIRTHSKFNEAVAIEITNPSPERVTPPCPHYLTCAGCSFQHLAPEAQIKFKEDLLKEQLQHAGNCQPQEYLPALQADTLGYRRKARLSVKYVAKKNKVLVGFHELNGRMIADINSCVVLSEKFGKLLPEFSHLIGSLSNFQNIPQIECAEGDNDSAIIIRHLTPFVAVDIERLQQFGQKHSLAIFLQPKGPDSIHKLWPNDDNIYLHYELPDYQVNLAFHPSNFIQVNKSINRKMIVQALDLLQLNEKDQVLDLFCGIGNFSLPIARKAKKVLGVEGDNKMVELASYNARKNHLKNVEFTCADLNKQFEFTKHLKINKVLIDPPRTGAFEVLPHIVALKPERIVYVSCNPATLARDANYLNTNGYQLEKVGVLDMFPHTQHVESMALFVKI